MQLLPCPFCGKEPEKLIKKTSPTKIVVEIDLSKSFSDVINMLSEVIEDMR